LEITFSEGREVMDVLKTDDPIIKISFRMVVEDLIDSELMQLIPLDFAQSMVENLHKDSIETTDDTAETDKTQDYGDMNLADVEKTEKIQRSGHVTKDEELEEKHVVVKSPEFETFDAAKATSYKEPIDLVGEIPVELTVELGRTTKRIEEILSYGPGTIVELDKLLGEPLNVYANGRYIAKGEVVVIDDNFGIRITDIDKS